MQTIHERKKYRWNNFIELHRDALYGLFSRVESIDTNIEAQSMEEKVMLKLIERRKTDTSKMREYLIQKYTEWSKWHN